MNAPTLSPQQLARLRSLTEAPAKKEKTSITLSSNLLKVITVLAGTTHRSAWIEEAVRRYARRELKRQRRIRELELLNRHADALNAEGAETAAFQAPWDAE